MDTYDSSITPPDTVARFEGVDFLGTASPLDSTTSNLTVLCSKPHVDEIAEKLQIDFPNVPICRQDVVGIVQSHISVQGTNTLVLGRHAAFDVQAGQTIDYLFVNDRGPSEVVWAG